MNNEQAVKAIDALWKEAGEDRHWFMLEKMRSVALNMACKLDRVEEQLAARAEVAPIIARLDAKITKYEAVRGTQPAGTEEQLLRDARDALRYADHVRIEQESKR